MEYKNFGSDIHYNAAAECFDGIVVGSSRDLTFSGKSIAELRRNFEATIDQHLANCNSKRVDAYQQFPGNLTLRVGTDLHRDIYLAARAEGKPVNKWIRAQLAECVARTRKK